MEGLKLSQRETVLLEYLIKTYKDREGDITDFWILLFLEEIIKETWLNDYNLRVAKKKLEYKGLIKINAKWIPKKLYYQLLLTSKDLVSETI